MKKATLLAVLFLVLGAVSAGCNGAGLDEPINNPLPGSETDIPVYDYDGIEANHATDKLPEREFPPIPIDDPVWDPVFDSLTEDETCIDEGCMSFELIGFDEDNQVASFRGVFFNPNAGDWQKLTILLVLTDAAMGITPVNPDGTWKFDELDVNQYPYYAFNTSNNGDSHQIPGTMYCYFEREISFTLEYGSDFYVDYALVPLIDKKDIYVIDPEDKAGEDNESPDEGDGRTGDSSTFGSDTTPNQKSNSSTPDSETPSGGSSFSKPGITPPDD